MVMVMIVNKTVVIILKWLLFDIWDRCASKSLCILKLGDVICRYWQRFCVLKIRKLYH